MAAVTHHVAEIAVTAAEVVAVRGYGGEFGRQLLINGQGLAVLLLRLRSLSLAPQQIPQVEVTLRQYLAKRWVVGEVGRELLLDDDRSEVLLLCLRVLP